MSSVIEIEHPKAEDKRIDFNNNTSILYSGGKPPHIKTYKCPYMDCLKAYFSEDDKDHHLIYDHHEMPKKMAVEMSIDVGANNFSKKDLQKIKIMQTKQMLRRWSMLWGALAEKRKEIGEKRKFATKLKRDGKKRAEKIKETKKEVETQPKKGILAMIFKRKTKTP